MRSVQAVLCLRARVTACCSAAGSCSAVVIRRLGFTTISSPPCLPVCSDSTSSQVRIWLRASVEVLSAARARQFAERSQAALNAMFGDESEQEQGAEKTD